MLLPRLVGSVQQLCINPIRTKRRPVLRCDCPRNLRLSWRQGIIMRVAALAGLAGLIALSTPALALDKVTFGTNWLADPEAGGYYQAVVDGTCAKYGLDVTIRQGGPQSNAGLRSQI